MIALPVTDDWWTAFTWSRTQTLHDIIHEIDRPEGTVPMLFVTDLASGMPRACTVDCYAPRYKTEPPRACFSSTSAGASPHWWRKNRGTSVREAGDV